MPEFLELAQLAHGDRMPKMKIGGGGIVATIDTQRFASFFGFDQAFSQFFSHIFSDGRVAKIGTLHKVFNLLIDVHLRLLHGHVSACDRLLLVT